MKKLSKRRAFKLARVTTYGAAGVVAGTYAGFPSGHGVLGGRMGAGIGMAVGTGVESLIDKKIHPNRVQSTEPSIGEKVYKQRVGTKINGRVGKKDLPFNRGGK